MTQTAAYRLRQHLARDVEAAQEDLDAARRARRRQEWPDTRADLLRRWVASKRALEDAGQPFVMPPPPDLECPAFFLASDESPREIIEPPAMPSTGIGAPGHDGLGRYVGPAVESRTAEEQLKDAAKGKRSLFGGWR